MVGTRANTLEGRWDILYRDYPKVYDEWVRLEKRPSDVEAITSRFPLQGRRIVDVGCGTGKSTLDLARFASNVVGVDPESSMRQIAIAAARDCGCANVDFVAASADVLPFGDSSVDAVIGVFMVGADDELAAKEAERVTRSGGYVIRLDCAPGWYGGELEPVITGKPRDGTPEPGDRAAILPSLGYSFFDVFGVTEYGSAQRAIDTFGFIHGLGAIEHIRARDISTIKWKVRIHHKQVSA